MGFGPPSNNPDGNDIPKCIQNSACINPHFSKDENNNQKILDLLEEILIQF